jgi:hypothetical protein
MTEFVRDGATQHYGGLRITVRETNRIFVVDTGEGRKEGNTEDLQPIRDAPGKYPKHDLARLSLATQPLWVGGGVAIKTV